MTLLEDYKEKFEEVLYTQEIKPYWDALQGFLDESTPKEINELREDQYNELWGMYESTVNRKREAKGFKKSMLEVEMEVLAKALNTIY